MLTTARYDDVRCVLGQRRFQATGLRWDGDDNQVIVAGEYRTLGAAKLASRAWVAHRGVDQVEIRRGAWVEQVIRESGGVPVRDADFEDEDGWAVRGWVDSERRIDWEEETW